MCACIARRAFPFFAMASEGDSEQIPIGLSGSRGLHYTDVGEPTMSANRRDRGPDLASPMLYRCRRADLWANVRWHDTIGVPI